MSTQAVEETRADAELISAVRGGDVDAYGVLFERHSMAATRLARQLVSAGDADDLVSEAFVKVLAVLQRGGGPDIAFRAYLLTAIRRLRVDRIRATSKLQTSDDMEMFDPGVPFRDTTIEGFENAAAARAFASLPERWQLVLWHTEVEEQKPADIAPLLGMTPNSVSALAYRAREGLRQAFLNEHVAEIEGDTCRWTHDHLGPYIRNGLSKRDVAKVDDHLEECRSCAAIYLELVEVNSNLGAILAPLLLGSAAVGYLASTSAAGAVGAGGLLVGLLDRAKDLVVANAATAAVGGVAAAVAVAGLTFAVVRDGPGNLNANDASSAISTTRDSVASATSPTVSATKAARRRTPKAATTTDEESAPAITTGLADPESTSSTPTPTGSPTSAPTTAPTTQPTAQPTTQPTAQPTTQAPTSGPTSGPTQTTSPTTSPTTKPTQSATPTPTPTPTPTQTPTPAPTATLIRDLAVLVITTGRMALYEDIAVTTTGIPAGETGTVTITATNATELTSGDSRCQSSGSGLVCTVAGDAPIAVRVQRIPNGNASLTVVVTSNGGPDSNPANNSTTLVLDSK